MATAAKDDRPVLALDIDEVLAGFVPALCAWHNDAYGTAVTPADFTSYHFNSALGGTDEETVAKVYQFFETPFFTERMPLVPGAVDAVAQLRRAGFKLVCVTSRQFVIAEQTRAWLDATFGAGAIEDVLFGNHWVPEAATPDATAAGVTKISKPDMVREVGAVALVDDSCKYMRQCCAAAAGGGGGGGGGMGPAWRKCVLFGDYAWNQLGAGEALPAGAVRCGGWAAALAELLPLAAGAAGAGGDD